MTGVAARHRRGAWLALLGVVGSLLVALGAAPAPAQAMPSAAGVPSVASAPPVQLWDPGLIITDANFYDGGAMTAPEIQAFLNARIGACQTDRCLNVITVDVANRARETGSTGQVVCEAITGGRMSAAELIYRAQVACGISAKVILVTLQKEQGLVTSRAPSDWALRAAMGMACPDTAPCDSAFAGLATQIVAGTRQLKAYKANAFARQPGVHFIGWHPNGACGGTNVNVRNYATAALYNYTPYQPNGAALGNLYGTGDGCSSYGNRNFWRYYWDWFGNPQEKNGPEYIADAYAAQGGASGPLGAARGEATFVAGGWMREFAGGNIYWTAATGARTVSGDMLTKYLAEGGPAGWLRWPYGAATSATSNGVAGTWQWFQGATMYASPGGGAHVVVGAMRDHFASTGGLSGPLGWPVGDETTVAAGGGGSVQEFRGGTIHRSAAGGFRVVSGDLLTAFEAAGGPAGGWGWPTGDATAISAGGVSGLWQWFQGGTAYSTASGGAHLVSGTARTLFGSLGGLSGSLGWPTSDPVARTGNGGGTVQRFLGGAIFVSNARGAQAVVGGLLEHYESRGGPEGELGWPTGLAICDAAGTCTQPFENGTVRWSPDGGAGGDPGSGAYPVTGAIGDLYRELGGSRGILGLPTSHAEYTAAGGGGYVQTFQGGNILQRSGSGPYVVTGAMLETYRASGGPGGALGWPTGAPTEATSNDVPGLWQWFQGATMYWSAGTGARAVGGSIKAAFAAAGGLSGPLGWPSGDESVDAANGGGSSQAFLGGAVYRSAGGTRVVSGDILAAYRAAGGPAGSWGWPTGDATAATSNGRPGVWQWFQRTTAYAGRDLAAFAVGDSIKAAFAAAGGLSGPLGWPVGAETASSASGGGASQAFQGGAIYRSASGTHVVDGAILTAYQAAGGPGGAWGWPAGAPTAITANGVTGRWQWFQNVTLYSTASTGTHAVGGATKALFASLGGLSGVLGWPTGAPAVQTANGGGTTQTFQGGVIYDSPAGAHRVLGAFATKYAAAGGPAGSLGWPAGPEIAWSARGVTGSYQNFQSGIVYSSPHGTHIVAGAIRTAYGVAGGSPGPLGWPTSDAASVSANGGGLAQSFQGGAVYHPAGAATAYPVSGSAFARYQELGGPASSVGWPIGAPTAWSASGVSGQYQYFQTATMYESSLGVRFVGGDIRSTYSALGGSTGPLGWPRGDASCSAGACTQAFQGGDVRTFGASASASAVGGPMLTAYLAAGGPGGALGAPGGNAVAVTANGVTGAWQYFSGSAIIMYWTPQFGTHHISGGIRTYFSTLGGLAGSGLGWPVGAQECTGDVCRQRFQGGTIVWDPARGGRVE